MSSLEYIGPEKPAEKSRRSLSWKRRRATKRVLLTLLVFLAVTCCVLLALLSSELIKKNGKSRTCNSDDCVQTEYIEKAGSVQQCTGKHCRQPGEEEKSFQPSKVCLTKECIQAAASILTKMDLTVNPCEDFYQFACGNYVKNNVVPDDHYVRSTLQQMQEEIYIIVKRLMEEPISQNDSESSVKLKTLYASCLNESFLEDSSPLIDLLTKDGLGVWPLLQPKENFRESEFELEHLLAQLVVFQVQPFIESYVSPDDKNATTYLLQFYRGSPALEREYYLNTTSMDHAKYLMIYEHLIVSVARVLGGNAEMVQDDVAEMIEFEKKFANISQSKWYQDEDNSTDDSQNKLMVEDLVEEIPEIHWSKLLQAIFSSIDFDTDIPSLIIGVHCRTYLVELVNLLETTPKHVISNYLIWRFIMKYLPYSDRELRRLYADFRREVPEPGDSRTYCGRWKECVALITDGMGLAVGALYVQNQKPSLAEKQLYEMILSIRKAFIRILSDQDWLDQSTKKACKEKLEVMEQKLGFPQFILNETVLNDDYNDLEVTDDRLLTNVLKMKRFEVQREIKKLLRPVNKDRDWIESPVAVNAYYRPNFNEIIFPVGILRDPIFNLNRPMYLNYGSIGVVIGHEMTHGFDNHGRRYDKSGYVTQWWPEDTVERFNKEAACFVEQYSEYEMSVIGQNVNGNETLGDNICDNAGLRQAYLAYHDWVLENGEEPALPGVEFRNDQLFFITYAQIWCEVVNKEGYIKYSKDYHSPGQYRTIGVVSNSVDFSQAFRCPLGSPMNPVKKCRLWG